MSFVYTCYQPTLPVVVCVQLRNGGTISRSRIEFYVMFDEYLFEYFSNFSVLIMNSMIFHLLFMFIH